jgi:hypothetical protein
MCVCKTYVHVYNVGSFVCIFSTSADSERKFSDLSELAACLI